jgi:hypothetical protein
MNPVTFSVLHVNSTGQMPKMGNWGLIDLDTPKVRARFWMICIFLM